MEEKLETVLSHETLAARQKLLYEPFYARLMLFFAWLTLASAVIGGGAVAFSLKNIALGVSLIVKGVIGWMGLLALRTIVCNLVNINGVLEALLRQSAVPDQ